ncbi:MAG: hypothetical protein ABSC94_29385, partial [Polyangiaceae bacterium]
MALQRPIGLVETFSCAALLVACTSATKADPPSLQPVSVALPVAASVPVCAYGYAHPNICCKPGPGASPGCQTNPSEPFRPCTAGWLTFPELTACCSLESPSDCGLPLDADIAAIPDDGGTFNCYFACGAGGYLPSALPAGSTSAVFDDCVDSDSALDCPVCCYGTGGEACIGSGGLGEVSAGASDAENGLACPECPNGWVWPQGGQIDVCCRAVGGVPEACFSQASTIADPPSGGPSVGRIQT